MVNLKEYDCLYKPFNTCDHLLHVLQPKFSFFFMFTLHWKCAFVTCKTTLTVNCNCSCTSIQPFLSVSVHYLPLYQYPYLYLYL